MKIKTNDLTGAALDWAVCKAGGGGKDLKIFWSGYIEFGMYHYSTNWSQGGPIIEREKIQILPRSADWVAVRFGPGKAITGTTPLIAAMRCYVASKLGDEIEIPKELTT
jgi:hypothetical protein